jgi:hypothetical protein
VTEALKQQHDMATAWYRGELQKLHCAFAESAGTDITTLKEVVEQFREKSNKLEVQKKLLINQVCTDQYFFSKGSYFYGRLNSLLLVIKPVLFIYLNICGRF